MDAPKGPQARNVCFTINALEGEDLVVLDPLLWPSCVTYVIYQREIGSHEHFQGYMELNQSRTYEQMHQWPGLEGAHFEKRRGSAQQASHYCCKPVEGCYCRSCVAEREAPSKLEGPWVFGEISRQGQRQDLLEVKMRIDRNEPVKRIAQDAETFPTWVKFHKAFDTYARIRTKERDFKTVVILFCGPSGVGKTRTALTLCRFLGSVYTVPSKHTGFWCDDYANEDVMFIDEMNGDKMRPEFWNGLADRYGFVVPAHGHAGHQFTSKYLVVCSNYHPKYWWKKRTSVQLLQTMRRIDWLFAFMHHSLPVACSFCTPDLKCPFHHD